MSDLVQIKCNRIKELIFNYQNFYGELGYYNIYEIISNLFSILIEKTTPIVYYKIDFLINIKQDLHPHLNDLCINILSEIKKELSFLDKNKKYFIKTISRDYSYMLLYKLNS